MDQSSRVFPARHERTGQEEGAIKAYTRHFGSYPNAEEGDAVWKKTDKLYSQKEKAGQLMPLARQSRLMDVAAATTAASSVVSTAASGTSTASASAKPTTSAPSRDTTSGVGAATAAG